MSIPDGTMTFEFTFNRVLGFVIGVFVVLFLYGIIFIALPFEEDKAIQLDEIENKMSCGDLKEMILDKSGISMNNRAQALHQYEWRCEK